jgi:hypothetical protein
MGFELSPSELAGWADEPLHDIATFDRSDDPGFIVRPNRNALD